MYKEIDANKRKSTFILASFFGLVAGVSWIFANYVGEPSLTPFILLGAGAYAMVTYYAGSKMALAMNGAKQIQKRDNPRLWRIVENLSITNGMPMPKVYVVNDPAANAFATGRNPEHAVVAATTGILDVLNDSELEGVMAHEMGHVKNYDIRVSLIAFALAAAIGILSDLLIRIMWFGGDDDDAHPFFLVLGLLAAVLAPIIAAMIQMAISRRREYLADATGALTTRHPEALASALEKISKVGSAPRRQNPSSAHLFFANPLKKGSFTSLFSTHPPIQDRIARLRKMDSNGG